MPTPGEQKTVQARILAYAEVIGWTFVSRKEAEQRRAGFPTRHDGKKAYRNVRAPLSLFFDDLLDVKVREFNPRYAEAEGALLGKFPPPLGSYGATGRHLHSDIYGNPPSPNGYVATGREFQDKGEEVA